MPFNRIQSCLLTARSYSKCSLVFGFGLSTLVAAAPSKAQNAGDVVKITLVSTETLPEPGGRAIVIRRSSGDPRTMIVLPAEGASAEDLASALGSLSGARARDHDVFSDEQRISITSTAFTRTPAPPDVARLEQLLQKLSRAHERRIRGVGLVKAVDVSITLSYVGSTNRGN